MSVTEYLYLTPAPPLEEITSLLALAPEPQQLSTQLGRDALGRERCILTLTAPSREEVAALRGKVLAECRLRGWKAVVV